jgi:hypothetical protein
MAVTVTHPFVSAISDGADATVVRPSNWNATHSLTGTLDVANGGTNITTYAIGDLIYASTAGVLSKLADVATGNALISGGVGVAPSYGKVGLTTHVSGTLPIANGGTNSTATATAGGAGYGTGTAHAYTAAGTSGQVLTSAGASAPTWATPTTGTVTAVSVASANGLAGTSSGGATPALTLSTSITGLLKGNGTAISAATAGTDYLTPTTGVTTFSGNSTGLTPSTATSGAITLAGTLAVANGGTNITTYAIGDLIYASTTGVLSKLADVATGNSLISGGVGVAPSYGKVGLTTHVSGTLPVANGGTNATTASITSFNNITGYTASGATGTTSTNLVFSASPTFTGTLGAAAITASTTLGVTGTSTLSGNAIISVTDNTNAALRITQLGTGNALLVEDTTNPDATPFVIDNTGNVGIGGASAGYKLDVIGDAVYAAARFYQTTAGQNTDIYVNNVGSANNFLLSRRSNGESWLYNSGADPFVFSTNATERMRISSTGLLTVTNGAVIQGLTVGKGANAVASNTAVGVSALASGSLSGTSNVAVGYGALAANTINGNNTAVGANSLITNTSGYSNTAVGSAALAANISGGQNVALGVSALSVNTGNNNIALGYNAGNALTNGANNTIIGSVAGTAGLSDTVIIAAGSAERMRIDSTGLMKVPGGISGGTF